MQAHSAGVPLYVRLWKYFKGGVIFLVVVFHLAVLAVRNPLDLWYNEVRASMQNHQWDAKQTWWDRFGKDERGEFRLADNFTWKYTNTVGMEQRWSMFSPPLARGAPFLAVRLEFTGGTSETILSTNEPDPGSYFRVGGWQVRKLEDYLMWPSKDLASDGELPLWEAFARYKARQWRANRPGDPRQVQRIVLVRRRLSFPEPDQTSADVKPPSEEDVLSFDATGKLLP
jgi:hypothetical protein